MRKIYTIVVVYTRPEAEYEDVEFLNTYHARAEEQMHQKLRNIFTKSFKKAHPIWPIKRLR